MACLNLKPSVQYTYSSFMSDKKFVIIDFFLAISFPYLTQKNQYICCYYNWIFHTNSLSFQFLFRWSFRYLMRKKWAIINVFQTTVNVQGLEISELLPFFNVIWSPELGTRSRISINIDAKAKNRHVKRCWEFLKITRLSSPVSRLHLSSLVSCLMPLVSCLLSLVSCLPSPVSRLSPPVSLSLL